MVFVRKMELSEACTVKKVAKKAFSGIVHFFVSNPKEAMVAVVDEKIVGGIIIKYIISNDKKIGYVDGAFIDPAYQGQGIGGVLYQKTIEYLWGQDCTALSAFVKDDNVGSWKLFLNNGFCQTSILEGVRQLGLRQMFLQYFVAPFFACNGMEFYLAVKDGEVKPKQSGSVKQIALYIFANMILFLFSLLQKNTNFPAFLSAYVTLLLGGVLFGYIGTIFSKERWHFRLNSGGAALVAFITAIGGLYPMIGNWYPPKYHNTKEFQKSMGLTAACEWVFVICITIAALILQGFHVFFEYLTSIGMVFLLYRMIAIYPFESYGGNRVYRWNKGIYAALAAISAFVIVITGYIK